MVTLAAWGVVPKYKKAKTQNTSTVFFLGGEGCQVQFYSSSFATFNMLSHRIRLQKNAKRSFQVPLDSGFWYLLHIYSYLNHKSTGRSVKSFCAQFFLEKNQH